MQIKLLACDLDGTLLRGDKTLSPATVSALVRCREKGIKVAFATARPYRTVKPYLKQFPADAAICHNGAFTVRDGERIGERFPIPFADAEALLSVLARMDPDRTLSLEMDDTLYANFDVAANWPDVSYIHTDFSDLPHRDADKLLAGMTGYEELPGIEALLPEGLYAQATDGGKLCMVMNRKANKENAVKALAKEFGISLAETAAFGDDLNDVGLLSLCGVGVAMANAVPQAKKAARYLTKSNEEDGVAGFLLEYVL